MKEKLFSVYQCQEGFGVEHIPTGSRHWLGKGDNVLRCCKTQIVNEIGNEREHCFPLDVLSVGNRVIVRVPDSGYYAGPLSRAFLTTLCEWLQSGQDKQMMLPNDPDFREAWEEFLNENESDTLEKYFPYLVEEIAEQEEIAEDKDRRRGLYGPEWPGEQF